MVISQITGVKFSLTLFPTTLQYETLKEKKNEKQAFMFREAEQEERFLH